MAFAGFIFPGLLWCLCTPGDTEMISLVAAGLFGVAGLCLLVIVSVIEHVL